MSDNNGGGGKFVGFIAFVVTMFAAVLYLVAMILSFLNISSGVIASMQSIASVIMICMVSGTGWRYVKTKKLAWKLIYILILLAVVASVVVPLVLQLLPAK